jgi:glycosyltransferase A (GT-A) superfamily protein (DUF2064 family)
MNAMASHVKPALYLTQNQLLLKPILSDTAILLFSRSVRAETDAKPLLKGRGMGMQRLLTRKLIAHARKIAAKSGFPIIFFSENQQQGANFASRYVHAFESVFAMGYSKVISIGNDCPGLQTSDILKAHAALDQHGMVSGPAEDGGVYLLGFRKDTFQAEALLGVAWQTSKVQQQLAFLYPDGLIVNALRADLDTPSSFIQWATSGVLLRSFWNLLKTFLAGNPVYTVCKYTFCAPHLLEQAHLRAPPGSMI